MSSYQVKTNNLREIVKIRKFSPKFLKTSKTTFTTFGQKNDLKNLTEKLQNQE